MNALKIVALVVPVALASLPLVAVGCTKSSEHQHGDGAGAHSHDAKTAPHDHDQARAPDTAPPKVAADAAYTCPMHPDVKSATPGKCPKCGMDLVAVAPTGAAAPSAPTVTVSSTPAKPEATKPAKLVLKMTDGTTPITSFDVVHDKKLHLLIVRPDLSFFAHEHPEPQPDGSFVIDFAFPSGGAYRLFADFKATNKAGAVVPVDVEVAGAPAPAQPLVASNLAQPTQVKTKAGTYRVRMTTTPPAATQTATLKFLVTRDNKPVKDLEPYLGALGHLVIIHEDGKTFLHSHPEDHVEPHDDTGKAPHSHAPPTGEIAFAAFFPKPGMYKAWAQFLHKGEVMTADFVFDVKPSDGAPAPAPAHDHGSHQH